MRTTLLLFLILPLWAFAQMVDDFSDGNFTANPTWMGTDSSFMVNNSFQLQSSATTAGEAWLATVIASEAKQSTVDECGLRRRYAPRNDVR